MIAQTRDADELIQYHRSFFSLANYRKVIGGSLQLTDDFTWSQNQ